MIFLFIKKKRLDQIYLIERKEKKKDKKRRKKGRRERERSNYMGPVIFDP